MKIWDFEKLDVPLLMILYQWTTAFRALYSCRLCLVRVCTFTFHPVITADELHKTEKLLVKFLRDFRIYIYGDDKFSSNMHLHFLLRKSITGKYIYILFGLSSWAVGDKISYANVYETKLAKDKSEREQLE